MGVPEIDVAELVERQARGASIIDVRQPAEYSAGHVPGAVLIPLAEVPHRIGELSTEDPVLIICHSGVRSRQAAEQLRPLGVDAINVRGGTQAWISQGYAVVTGPEPD